MRITPDLLFLEITERSLHYYIRFDVTLIYLTLIMNAFIDENNLRGMIEKALIFYLFHKTIDEKKFENIEFPEYCKRLENKFFLNSVLERIHSLDINIFKDNTDKVVTIIDEEFRAIL